MKTLAFANHKGGVAKTTTAYNVGACLALKGKRVLLVDLDAQASLTSCAEEWQPSETIFSALVEKRPLPIHKTDTEGLDLVPSSLDLSTAEMRLSTEIGREYILRNLLAGVSDKYDFALLDCPPACGIMAINALCASDFVFIPTTADPLAAKGAGLLADLAGQIKPINKDLQVGGVILTRYEGRKIEKTMAEGLKGLSLDVLNTKIRKCVKISEAVLYHKPAAEYAPGCTGAEDYKALTEEILNIVK